MLGTKAIMEVLKSEGVDLVFGYPGGQVVALFNEFHDEKDIRLVLPRHEQGGAFAAGGYARATGKVGSNKKAAEFVGELVAKRAVEKGITEVTFDRGGRIYHGRVKALADGARNAGLKF